MPRRRLWVVAMLLLGLALPRPAAAGGLSNTETFGGFEFNFNNPGARSLAMGGAFIGVADDATAVVANPAGLTILQRPELSAEVKFTRYTNNIRAFTNTLAEGLAGEVHDRDFTDSVTTPSFFSFVYPTERLVVAVFARELVNFESNFETEGVIFRDEGGALLRLFPVQSSMKVTAVNLGAGVGLNLSKNLRWLPDVGFSIEFSHGVVHSKLQRFDFVGPEPPNFSRDNVFTTTLVDDSDIGIGFNVGLLWRPIKDFSVGGVYRRGPRYNMRQTLEGGPALGAGTREIFDFSLKVPDVYGAGVGVRFFDRLTLLADVVRIRYSQLIDDFQLVFASGIVRKEDYRLDDATEYHVGAEYILFVKDIPVALRAGFYYDPDHRIRYEGSNVTNQLLFPGGKDQFHGTGGVGFVPFPGVQFDFATNVSSQIREFSLSTVIRF